jgi:hypothetical protein
MASLAPLRINDAELEQMSDTQLGELEDRLLLDNELDTSPRAQFTSGRLVVFALSAVGILIFMALLSRFPTQKLGPLNIPLYLLALGLGVLTGHLLWSKVGRQARTAIRWVLAYWPVVLYLAAQIYGATRR